MGVDWGSSNLRVALIGSSGAVIDRRDSPAGVFTIKDGNFAQALWSLCSDWLTEYQVPLLACGMIGSRQGIRDIPYVQCPTNVRDLARSLEKVEVHFNQTPRSDASVNLFIVPGIRIGSQADGWDVMRGEETQLFGVPSIAGNLCVLPGTHSKWILLGADDRLDSFQTYLTGELFELLSTQGSLSRVMSEPQWSPHAFEQGVSEAHRDALENLLFKVRTAGLMNRLPAPALTDYLSGLLIGSEVKAGLSRFDALDDGEIITVVGASHLTNRYAIAISAFGRRTCEVPEDVVFGGLFAIATTAGLMRRAPGLHDDVG